MRILATDLDRTLLPNGHWPADPGAIALFNELTERHDVLVVYVTGRNLSLAEAAIRQVLDHELFVVDQKDEFDFLTYGSSVSEVRAYWEEQNAYEEEPKAKDILVREEYLYAQVEEILEELGEGAEVAFRERVRIERLRPLK